MVRAYKYMYCDLSKPPLAHSRKATPPHSLVSVVVLVEECSVRSLLEQILHLLFGHLGWLHGRD